MLYIIWSIWYLNIDNWSARYTVVGIWCGVIWVRKVWKYQKGQPEAVNRGMKWPKQKGQKDKQRSIKHYTEN